MKEQFFENSIFIDFLLELQMIKIMVFFKLIQTNPNPMKMFFLFIEHLVYSFLYLNEIYLNIFHILPPMIVEFNFIFRINFHQKTIINFHQLFVLLLVIHHHFVVSSSYPSIFVIFLHAIFSLNNNMIFSIFFSLLHYIKL